MFCSEDASTRRGNRAAFPLAGTEQHYFKRGAATTLEKSKNKRLVTCETATYYRRRRHAKDVGVVPPAKRWSGKQKEEKLQLRNDKIHYKRMKRVPEKYKKIKKTKQSVKTECKVL